MVYLGPIEILLGLPLNINVNYGQNQFEVHISINMAKRANFQPKIDQDATFAPTLNGPPLSDFDIKIISSSRRIEWFLAHILLRGLLLGGKEK